MARESKIRTDIVKIIRARGGRPIKYYGCIYSEAGASDLFVCYRGRFVVIETKIPGAKMTQKQEAFQAEILNAGGFAGPASSVAEASAILDQVESAIANLLSIASDLELAAEMLDCICGNPDGGGIYDCERCNTIAMAEAIRHNT